MRERFILRDVDIRFIHETCRRRFNWTLMCPNECPGLYDVYGEEFEVLCILIMKTRKREEKPLCKRTLGENP